MWSVEFIGGPFDGHQQVCVANPGKPPAEVIRLVCDDAFQQLAGPTRVRSGEFTSVALYRLEQKEDSRRYLFAGALSFTKFDELLRDLV